MAIKINGTTVIDDSRNLTNIGSANVASLSLGANTLSLASSTTISSFGASLIDDANASTARATLELGTGALLDAGTSANNLVQLDSSSKLPAVDGSQLTNITAGGFIPLQTQNFTNVSTLEFTSNIDSNYDLYAISLKNIKMVSGTSGDDFRAQLGTSGGWLTSSLYINSYAVIADAVYFDGAFSNASYISIAGQTGNDSASRLDCLVYLLNPNDTTRIPSTHSESIMIRAHNYFLARELAVARYDSSALGSAITRIRFYFANSNMTGSATLFGVK